MSWAWCILPVIKPVQRSSDGQTQQIDHSLVDCQSQNDTNSKQDGRVFPQTAVNIRSCVAAVDRSEDDSAVNMSDNDGLDQVWDDTDRISNVYILRSTHHGRVTHLSIAAEQTTQLVLELQQCAFEAGHPVPLAIGLDQENGGVNSLFDEIFIRQYPSAMGLAATGSRELALDVARATAEEISACGINLMMGPCLDVLTNARNQPLGVRTTGDDPQEVSSYGVAFMKGYKEAGLATMGKHFPSYGSLEFLGSALDVPTITESLESLSLNALIPFRNAIKEGLDAMMVGGCAMNSAGLNVMHACLSGQVVNDLLRSDLNFDGVVISDCLEMEALSHNIGVGGGTVMAINAGCDIVLLCRSYTHQQEALEGFKLGVENSMIQKERIRVSLKRVLDMKAKCTSWEKALNPPGISLLSKLQPAHTTLSTKAYNSSITVVRDKNRLLPLANIMEPEDELLLLTPLVKPLVASAAARALSEQACNGSPEPALWERSASVMSGERVFRELGRSLARQRSGRVLHTSYTANGVRPQHENLISRASAIIIVTADANRNLYQHGFTKHVSMICNMGYTSGGDKREKPVIVVAVSSPYDFAMDQTIGTYICTYDFTETALTSLVRVLYGEFTPAGALPGTISQSQKLSQSKQHWLVEAFNEERDSAALDVLLQATVDGHTPGLHSELSSATSNSILLHNPEILESHFVVRNSSTQALYGFCCTYFFKASGTGAIGAIFVDPSRRKLSIGHSLHNRAIRTLMQREGIKRFQLGSRLPSIYLGIPTGHGGERKRLRSWFANLGWNTALSRAVCQMAARNLSTWAPPEGMAKSLQSAGADFNLVYGLEYAGPVLDHIKTNNRQGLAEVYKMALADPSACGVIQAKRPEDGALVGTVVLYNHQSVLAEFVPSMRDMGELTGGISSPVISPSVGDYSTLLQGLILLGMRQIKQQGCNACVLDYMDGDGNFDGLSAMGFDLLHSFEEVSCDAATWTMMPPS
nr:beta-hexosaminidase [Quercus suber]